MHLAIRDPGHIHYGLKWIPVFSVGILNPRGWALLILSQRYRAHSDLWVSRIRYLVMNDSSHKGERSLLSSNVCIHIFKVFPG